MRAKWSMLFGPEGSIILWPKGSILFGQRGQICLAFPYILSEIVGEIFREVQWTTLSFDAIWQPLFGNYGGSLCYALVFLLLNWLVALFLYKKHIYIKL